MRTRRVTGRGERNPRPGGWGMGSRGRGRNREPGCRGPRAQNRGLGDPEPGGQETEDQPVAAASSPAALKGSGPAELPRWTGRQTLHQPPAASGYVALRKDSWEAWEAVLPPPRGGCPRLCRPGNVFRVSGGARGGRCRRATRIPDAVAPAGIPGLRGADRCR